MPPVGSHLLDPEGIDLIKRWITETLPHKTFAEWQQHFSSAVSVQELEPTGDTDHDGWNNLSEYHLGTDPTFALDRWRLRLDVSRETLFIPNPPGIELRLESSLFLGNAVEWEPVEISETIEPVFGYKGLLESKLEGFNEGSKFYRATIIFPELK